MNPELSECKATAAQQKLNRIPSSDTQPDEIVYNSNWLGFGYCATTQHGTPFNFTKSYSHMTSHNAIEHFRKFQNPNVASQFSIVNPYVAPSVSKAMNTSMHSQHLMTWKALTMQTWKSIGFGIYAWTLLGVYTCMATH